MGQKFDTTLRGLWSVGQSSQDLVSIVIADKKLFSYYRSVVPFRVYLRLSQSDIANIHSLVERILNVFLMIWGLDTTTEVGAGFFPLHL